MLEQEIKTFEQKLPELVKNDLGKFVLIMDTQVIGTFVAVQDALQAGYEHFKERPFFIRQINAIQEPLNFANNHLLH